MRYALILCLLFLPLTACAEKAPNFAKGKATIMAGDIRHEFTIEIAQTPEQLQHGLMFRRSMPANHGMLFLFPKPQPISMWMKNTYIPLDMLFLNEKGVIVDIHENAVPESLAIIAAKKPAQMVLEVNAGTVARLGLSIGQTLTYESLPH
jgi:uncharacterized membrane protein (UPF0127 family)